jgi:hypothetical protein
MQKFIFGFLLVALVFGSSLNVAKATSPVQNEVGGVLVDKLKLEAVPAAPGNAGGEETYKVTDKTIEHLKGLKEKKEAIEVPNVNENSAIVRDALKSLQLKLKPQPKGLAGGTYELEITDETLKELKGKSVVVDSKGKAKIK